MVCLKRFLCFVFLSQLAVGQLYATNQNEVDSLCQLCIKYQSSNSDSALWYGRKALEQAKKIEYVQGVIDSYINLGNAYLYNSEYDKALEYYRDAQLENKTKPDKKSASKISTNSGLALMYKGEYEQALESFLKGCELDEELKDTAGLANDYNNIARIHFYLSNTDKVEEYLKKAMNMYLAVGNKAGAAAVMNNIGAFYYGNDDLQNARKYFHQALNTNKELNNLPFVASAYGNIALTYLEEKNYERAEELHQEALKIFLQIGDKAGTANSYFNFAELYTEQGDNKQAIKYLNEALTVHQELGSLDYIASAYEQLANAHKKLGDYQQALEYQQLYASTKDSLLNQEKVRAVTEMNTKYESEKKERENKILRQQNLIQEGEIQRQRIISVGAGGGVLLLLLLAFVLYNRNRIKKKANAQLQQAYNIIEEKNNDITHSIEYASTLQEAILPSDETMEKALKDFFVYFRPRDIVSGDFYWFHERDGLQFMIAADCTGHGVPGAFVSMLGNNLFNQVIIEEGESDPGKILTEVNKGLIAALRKEGARTKANDGMDLSLCVLNKKEKKIRFAGANNSLFLVKGNELIELKADRAPIGGRTAQGFQFTTKDAAIDEGDYIYQYSDGYADQFGGETGKKFKMRNFKTLLLKLKEQPAQKQREELHQTMMKWMGNEEQVDDILVIGVKV